MSSSEKNDQNDPGVTALRLSFETLRERIEASIRDGRGVEKDTAELKRALMEVYRSVDCSLAQLAHLKTDITALAERWKAERHPPPPRLSHPAGEQHPMYEDHLGASTFLEKGWSRISVGDYEGAEELLRRALVLSPNSAEARSLLGWAQMHQGRLDAALSSCQHVLSRDPVNGLAHINMGYICLRRGLFGDAIEHLSSALRQESDVRARLYANFYLGVTYIEREMYDDAQIFLERSIEIGPNLVEAYVELGHALWLNGQRDRATEVWERGAGVNPFNPWSRRCQELLTRVGGGGTPERVWLSRGGISDER